MKLDKDAYKNCEWKHYKIKRVYTWTVTATSKSSALGMIEDEIEHPKFIYDNDYVYPDKEEIVQVITDPDCGKAELIYDKQERNDNA